VPQHVLRFWETKFAQLRPLKRGGGRRYYRPEDVQLLFRIRELLYRDGYTIKGVQRLFRTEGVRGLEGGETLHPAMAEALEPETEPLPALRSDPPDLADPLNRRVELESVLRDLLEIRSLLRDPSEPS
jgi:DNA-binding transcriptional MerR regulator